MLLCHFLQICKRGFCWVSSFVNSVFFPFFMALIHLIFLLFKHQAIALCPNVPVYWTNRALCHRRRKYVRALPHFLCLSPYLDYISSGYFFFLALVFLRFTLLEFSDWTKVEEDSRKAIELDYNSVKVCIFGFFLLILILHSCILVFELDHSWKTTGYYSVIRRFNSSMLGNYKFARLQFNWLLYDFNYLNRSELHTARATIAFHKSIHPFNILFFLCHSFRWLIIILYFPI